MSFFGVEAATALSEDVLLLLNLLLTLNLFTLADISWSEDTVLLDEVKGLLNLLLEALKNNIILKQTMINYKFEFRCYSKSLAF